MWFFVGVVDVRSEVACCEGCIGVVAVSVAVVVVRRDAYFSA